MDYESLTADSTPTSAPTSCVRTCSKCKGHGVGDWGLKVRGGKCSACQGGLCFTAKAFARVVRLRLERALDRTEQKGAEEARKSQCRVKGCRASGIDHRACQLRLEWLRTRDLLHRARRADMMDNPTLAQVRIIVYGEDEPQFNPAV